MSSTNMNGSASNLNKSNLLTAATNNTNSTITQALNSMYSPTQSQYNQQKQLNGGSSTPTALSSSSSTSITSNNSSQSSSLKAPSSSQLNSQQQRSLLSNANGGNNSSANNNANNLFLQAVAAAAQNSSSFAAQQQSQLKSNFYADSNGQFDGPLVDEQVSCKLFKFFKNKEWWKFFKIRIIKKNFVGF